jgi:hypothetical protein
MELKRIYWNSARAFIAKAKPELAVLIDELSVSDEYPLYVVEYPYGANILDKGIFQLPNSENHLVSLNHSSIPNKIKEELGYTNTLPMGVVTRNSIETFFTVKERIIPGSLYGVGDMVSLWRVLEEHSSYHAGPLWSATSGAKSICMLPKITDKSSHSILKQKYRLKTPIPRTLHDHWSLFVDIANHMNFVSDWSSQIVFFTEKWFTHKGDRNWSEFYRYLVNEGWRASSFRRNQFIFDFAFSLAQANRNLKPNPYLADTLRHLIAIGSGFIPAFAPAIDDSAAPVSGLQQVFLNDYGLKKYSPVIMHLHHFSMTEKRPVYYSFEIPTTVIFSPRSRRISSKMSDMRELKHILEILISEILNGNLDLQGTPLLELAKTVSYNFFHTENDQSDEIINAAHIFNLDKNFSLQQNSQQDYSYPEFSPFFRGCISISSSVE